MKTIILASLLLLFAAAAFAQLNTYSSSNGVAIKGYDPVAYFTLNKATEGKAEFTYSWSGSQWKFVSQENLNLFKANPEKYAPQYGGFCAYGASQNHKSPTDPKAWTVVGEKLYLNYSPKVKELWMKDTSGSIKKADAFWPTLNQ